MHLLHYCSNSRQFSFGFSCRLSCLFYFLIRLQIFLCNNDSSWVHVNRCRCYDFFFLYWLALHIEQWIYLGITISCVKGYEFVHALGMRLSKGCRESNSWFFLECHLMLNCSRSLIDLILAYAILLLSIWSISSKMPILARSSLGGLKLLHASAERVLYFGILLTLLNVIN